MRRRLPLKVVQPTAPARKAQCNSNGIFSGFRQFHGCIRHSDLDIHRAGRWIPAVFERTNPIACLTTLKQSAGQPEKGAHMIDLATAPYAALLLRLCLGAMFIAHALLKWRVFTIPGTIAFF